MTPTWAQLHAMEPGLRPDGDGLVWCDRFWKLTNVQVLPIGTHDVSLPTFAAESCCRDKAARWLANDKFLHPKVLCNAPPWMTSAIDPPWEVGIYRPDDPDADEDTGYVMFGGETYDEALRAACAAVIGGRKS